MNELKKVVSVLVQQLHLLIVSTHILYLFLLYSCKSSRKKEILVNETGKKGWSRQMFELTKVEDSREMQKQFRFLEVCVIGKPSHLE